MGPDQGGESAGLEESDSFLPKTTTEGGMEEAAIEAVPRKQLPSSPGQKGLHIVVLRSDIKCCAYKVSGADATTLK